MNKLINLKFGRKASSGTVLLRAVTTKDKAVQLGSSPNALMHPLSRRNQLQLTDFYRSCRSLSRRQDLSRRPISKESF